jgi:hypothetical protein
VPSDLITRASSANRATYALLEFEETYNSTWLIERPEPSVEARARDAQCRAQPRQRPDRPVPRDEGELHVASLAEHAAAFFRMSRSALSFVSIR